MNKYQLLLANISLYTSSWAQFLNKIVLENFF